MKLSLHKPQNDFSKVQKGDRKKQLSLIITKTKNNE